MRRMILTMAVLLAGAGAFAEEAYLYWQAIARTQPFSYAYLTVTDSGGVALSDGQGGHVHLAVYDLGGGGPWPAAPSDADAEPWLAKKTIPVFSSLGDYAESQYGFMVEAYLDGGELAFTSGVSYFDSLVAASHVWWGKSSAMDPGGLEIWGAMEPVPEPSGGLLALLGLAALALRRERSAIQPT